MNILFVASEAAPLVKVGGLADVVGALPKELRASGHDVRVLLPFYGTIDRATLPDLRVLPASVTITFDGHSVRATVYTTALPASSVPLYLIDCPEWFGERGVYPSGQGPEVLRFSFQRFVIFSLLTARAIPDLDWQPDVVHCHDWHTSLVPVALAIAGHPARTILTIHNLHNQGVWGADEFLGWLGWSGAEHPSLPQPGARHDINLLQVGVRSAHVVNTVSPTYANEIVTPAFGEGLAADLAHHQPPVVGILNGLDLEANNPLTDSRLAARFGPISSADGKRVNKLAVQRECGLAPSANAPLFVAVSRLSPQKGFDLLPPVIGEIMAGGGQVAILGSGWPEIEGMLHQLADDFPRQLVVRLGFDGRLAQRLYAGGDFFLMPSRFEPCGLGQMIAMRYGTLPIARDTGGLHDTIVDIRHHPQTGTGWLFPNFEVADFQAALQSAVQVYRQPSTLQAIIRRAMERNFSWHQSAQDYLRLYAQA